MHDRLCLDYKQHCNILWLQDDLISTNSNGFIHLIRFSLRCATVTLELQGDISNTLLLNAGHLNRSAVNHLQLLQQEIHTQCMWSWHGGGICLFTTIRCQDSPTLWGQTWSSWLGYIPEYLSRTFSISSTGLKMRQQFGLIVIWSFCTFQVNAAWFLMSTSSGLLDTSVAQMNFDCMFRILEFCCCVCKLMCKLMQQFKQWWSSLWWWLSPQFLLVEAELWIVSSVRWSETHRAQSCSGEVFTHLPLHVQKQPQEACQSSTIVPHSDLGGLAGLYWIWCDVITKWIGSIS